MLRLEVLCVAMHQKDFSLVEKMNIRCDAVIANQTDSTSMQEQKFSWGEVKLVSSNTRGVGKNRNIAFLHATGDILLLSDDDMRYSDSYVEDVLSEFDNHPDADVVIFNILSSHSERKQVMNSTTKRINKHSKLPYGAPRIAIRRDAWEKSNVWFTVLFGGGAMYSNGEDSIFLTDLLKKGLTIYVSNKLIGCVNMNESSWYRGINEEFFFNKGAFCAATNKHPKYLYMLYYAFRVKSELPLSQIKKAFFKGVVAYRNGERYFRNSI